MSDDARDALPTDPHEEISNEVLRVHIDSYGTGAGSVSVHLLGDFVLVVLDDLELAVHEKTLIDGGRAEVVAGMRKAFQEEIGATFIAIVERAIGRRVTSFLSNTSLEARFSVEIFRLAPESAVA